MPANLGRNRLELRPADWVPAAEWRAASAATRLRYLRWVADRAWLVKREQVAAGRGGDGRRLAPVKPTSRPDGADGPPLDPHYGDSRAARLLRVSVGFVAGTVTLYWSHGFGKVLGYHARGEVIGAPIRDIIALPPARERDLQADARSFWRGLPVADRPAPESPRREAPRPRPAAVPFRLPPLAASPFAAEPIDLSAVTAGAGGMEALRRVLGGAGLVIDRGNLVRTTPSFIRRR